MFAVIEADLDYDYLAGLEFVAAFATDEEAQAFLRSTDKISDDEFLAKLAYIDRYVGGMEVPDLPYKEWMEYLAGFHLGWMHISKDEFLKKIRGHLRECGDLPEKNFHPPKVSRHRDLFVVEIPSCG